MEGINQNYYKTYYLISSILICFSIITFFINDKLKQYLIISVITLVFSLYMFEGYLIFNEQISNNKQISNNEQNSKNQLLKEKIYLKQTGKKWDKRSPLQIYIDLKKQMTKLQ